MISHWMLTKAYCENSGMVQQRPISNHCSAGISWKSCIVNSGICHIQALQMQWNLEAGGQPWKRICEDLFLLVQTARSRSASGFIKRRNMPNWLQTRSFDRSNAGESI